MKRSSGWQTNVLVFVIVIIFISAYFFWQTAQATREFQKHSLEHSEALAAVVELNIRNALLAKSGLEEIVGNSLENSARFLLFLDGVEPFRSAELTAFAIESGLAGAKIINNSAGTVVSGPMNWLPGRVCEESSGLQNLTTEKIYLFSFLSAGKCVLAGVSAQKIDAILDRISVKRLLFMLNDFHDIAYVRLESDRALSSLRDTSLKESVTDDLLETVIPVGSQQFVVALKADRFTRRIQQMKKEFLFFILLLIVVGGFSSLWLYRVQQQRLRQAREFEQKMGRQHEDAALGRAAATITHELRNPLNAIGMGLQRLQIESVDLDAEQHQLLSSMRDAVGRADNIITRLKQYSHSFVASSTPVNMIDIIDRVVQLYKPHCIDHSVEITLNYENKHVVSGDKDLLGQLIENVLKNSVEAQPPGGVISIRVTNTYRDCCVEIVNGGFHLAKKESRLLFEPYFSSKSRGTGLGLVISRKIAQAHRGSLDCQVDYDRREICFKLVLPLAGKSKELC